MGKPANKLIDAHLDPLNGDLVVMYTHFGGHTRTERFQVRLPHWIFVHTYGEMMSAQGKIPGASQEDLYRFVARGKLMVFADRLVQSWDNSHVNPRINQYAGSRTSFDHPNSRSIHALSSAEGANWG